MDTKSPLPLSAEAQKAYAHLHKVAAGLNLHTVIQERLKLCEDLEKQVRGLAGRGWEEACLGVELLQVREAHLQEIARVNMGLEA